LSTDLNLGPNSTKAHNPVDETPGYSEPHVSGGGNASGLVPPGMDRIAQWETGSDLSENCSLTESMLVERAHGLLPVYEHHHQW
jgi:hypothetical protein